IRATPAPWRRPSGASVRRTPPSSRRPRAAPRSPSPSRRRWPDSSGSIGESQPQRPIFLEKYGHATYTRPVGSRPAVFIDRDGTLCDCRKPKPGLLYRAAADHGLDLAQATLVGDKPSDLVTARAVGARSVLVLTGYGLGEWEHRRTTFPVPPDHVASDLFDAVD